MLEKIQLNQQLEMQKKYYASLREAMEAEHEVRHNFKHQLAALKGFLETGNTEELRQYCDTLENRLLNITEIPYTGNAAADGVLYHYLYLRCRWSLAGFYGRYGYLQYFWKCTG